MSDRIVIDENGIEIPYTERIVQPDGTVVTIGYPPSGAGASSEAKVIDEGGEVVPSGLPDTEPDPFFGFEWPD